MVTDSSEQLDVEELTSGLARFIDSVIIPLEEENADLLADHRGAFYDERGGYSLAVVELIRRSRMESAKAGYYAMFCPEDVGGGGLGRRAQLVAYEFLTRRYGP